MFSQFVLDYIQVLYMTKGGDSNSFDLLLFVLDKLTGSCLKFIYTYRNNPVNANNKGADQPAHP